MQNTPIPGLRILARAKGQVSHSSQQLPVRVLTRTLSLLADKLTPTLTTKISIQLNLVNIQLGSLLKAHHWRGRNKHQALECMNLFQSSEAIVPRNWAQIEDTLCLGRCLRRGKNSKLIWQIRRKELANWLKARYKEPIWQVMGIIKTIWFKRIQPC